MSLDFISVGPSKEMPISVSHHDEDLVAENSSMKLRRYLPRCR